MEVLELILGGVEPQFPQLTFPLVPRGAPNKEQMNAALEVMEEYIKIQAARELPVTELKSTKYLVPWFVIEKHSSEASTSVKKHRLISDCRKLNSALHPPKFRLESWKDILPHLRKGHWGVKLDIENAYFHLENSACLKPYLRMLIAGRLFQLEGGVFWSKHYAIPLAKTNEHLFKKVEKVRLYSFHLPRRHLTFTPLQRRSKETIKHSTTGHRGFRSFAKPCKIKFKPLSRVGPFRFPHQPGIRSTSGSSTQVKNDQERVGKIANPPPNDPQKNVLHSGSGQGLPNCNPPSGFLQISWSNS